MALPNAKFLVWLLYRTVCTKTCVPAFGRMEALILQLRLDSFLFYTGEDI